MTHLQTSDYYLFEKAARVLRALNHDLRHQIIELLEENEMSVTAIYTKLKLEQSVASQHLGILRKEGIVTTTRNGKEIIYKLDEQRMEEIKKAANMLVRNTPTDDHDTE